MPIGVINTRPCWVLVQDVFVESSSDEVGIWVYTTVGNETEIKVPNPEGYSSGSRGQAKALVGAK
jgi:hypothetical protein